MSASHQSLLVEMNFASGDTSKCDAYARRLISQILSGDIPISSVLEWLWTPEKATLNSEVKDTLPEINSFATEFLAFLSTETENVVAAYHIQDSVSENIAVMQTKVCNSDRSSENLPNMPASSISVSSNLKSSIPIPPPQAAPAAPHASETPFEASPNTKRRITPVPLTLSASLATSIPHSQAWGSTPSQPKGFNPAIPNNKSAMPSTPGTQGGKKRIQPTAISPLTSSSSSQPAIFSSSSASRQSAWGTPASSTQTLPQPSTPSISSEHFPPVGFEPSQSSKRNSTPAIHCNPVPSVSNPVPVSSHLSSDVPLKCAPAAQSQLPMQTESRESTQTTQACKVPPPRVLSDRAQRAAAVHALLILHASGGKSVKLSEELARLAHLLTLANRYGLGFHQTADDHIFRDADDCAAYSCAVLTELGEKNSKLVLSLGEGVLEALLGAGAVKRHSRKLGEMIEEAIRFHRRAAVHAHKAYDEEYGRGGVDSGGRSDERDCLSGGAPNPTVVTAALRFEPARDSRHNYKTQEEQKRYNNREKCRDALYSVLNDLAQVSTPLEEGGQTELNMKRRVHMEVLIPLLGSNFVWLAEVLLQQILHVASPSAFQSIGSVPVTSTYSNSVHAQQRLEDTGPSGAVASESVEDPLLKVMLGSQERLSQLNNRIAPSLPTRGSSANQNVTPAVRSNANSVWNVPLSPKPTPAQSSKMNTSSQARRTQPRKVTATPIIQSEPNVSTSSTPIFTPASNHSGSGPRVHSQATAPTWSIGTGTSVFTQLFPPIQRPFAVFLDLANCHTLNLHLLRLLSDKLQSERSDPPPVGTGLAEHTATLHTLAAFLVFLHKLDVQTQAESSSAKLPDCPVDVMAAITEAEQKSTLTSTLPWVLTFLRTLLDEPVVQTRSYYCSTVNFLQSLRHRNWMQPSHPHFGPGFLCVSVQLESFFDCLPPDWSSKIPQDLRDPVTSTETVDISNPSRGPDTSPGEVDRRYMQCFCPVLEKVRRTLLVSGVGVANSAPRHATSAPCRINGQLMQPSTSSAAAHTVAAAAVSPDLNASQVEKSGSLNEKFGSQTGSREKVIGEKTEEATVRPTRIDECSSRKELVDAFGEEPVESYGVDLSEVDRKERIGKGGGGEGDAAGQLRIKRALQRSLLAANPQLKRVVDFVVDSVALSAADSAANQAISQALKLMAEPLKGCVQRVAEMEHRGSGLTAILRADVDRKVALPAVQHAMKLAESVARKEAEERAVAGMRILVGTSISHSATSLSPTSLPASSSSSSCVPLTAPSVSGSTSRSADGLAPSGGLSTTSSSSMPVPGTSATSAVALSSTSAQMMSTTPGSASTLSAAVVAACEMITAEAAQEAASLRLRLTGIVPREVHRRLDQDALAQLQAAFLGSSRPGPLLSSPLTPSVCLQADTSPAALDRHPNYPTSAGVSSPAPPTGNTSDHDPPPRDDKSLLLRLEKASTSCQDASGHRPEDKEVAEEESEPRRLLSLLENLTEEIMTSRRKLLTEEDQTEEIARGCQAGSQLGNGRDIEDRGSGCKLRADVQEVCRVLAQLVCEVGNKKMSAVKGGGGNVKSHTKGSGGGGGQQQTGGGLSLNSKGINGPWVSQRALEELKFNTGTISRGSSFCLGAETLQLWSVLVRLLTLIPVARRRAPPLPRPTPQAPTSPRSIPTRPAHTPAPHPHPHPPPCVAASTSSTGPPEETSREAQTSLRDKEVEVQQVEKEEEEESHFHFRYRAQTTGCGGWSLLRSPGEGVLAEYVHRAAHCVLDLTLHLTNLNLVTGGEIAAGILDPLVWAPALYDSQKSPLLQARLEAAVPSLLSHLVLCTGALEIYALVPSALRLLTLCSPGAPGTPSPIPPPPCMSTSALACATSASSSDTSTSQDATSTSSRDASASFHTTLNSAPSTSDSGATSSFPLADSSPRHRQHTSPPPSTSQATCRDNRIVLPEDNIPAESRSLSSCIEEVGVLNVRVSEDSAPAALTSGRYERRTAGRRSGDDGLGASGSKQVGDEKQPRLKEAPMHSPEDECGLGWDVGVGGRACVMRALAALCEGLTLPRPHSQIVGFHILGSHKPDTPIHMPARALRDALRSKENIDALIYLHNVMGAYCVAWREVRVMNHVRRSKARLEKLMSIN